MQIGPARGETATLEVVVTADMAPTTAHGDTAPVYGTVAMVGHMEQVCRTLLLPHLEVGEDAVGRGVDVSHRQPAAVGATVTLTATVAEVRPQRLKCEVLVRQGTRLVARGSIEQRVVRMAEFAAEVAGELASPVA